jgi:NDP-sugar pyrophosphorylase family protein
MSKVQILMPLGGLGSRFAEQGYTVPKPLIEVDGKPMFMKALDSFSSLNNAEYIFVVRREQVDQYKIDDQIRQQLPDAKVTVLESNTRGAVETCLLAKNDIDPDLPLIIADCDIYFESSEYFKKISAGQSDALLLTFNSDHPRYSYVEIGDNGHAVRTAEKIVISNNAILGGYFFKTGELFKSLAEEFVSQPLPAGLKEYFVSHLFNIIIDRGGIVNIAQVDTMHIFGTPEELNAYLELSEKLS